jgi:hypothetical protein
MEKSTITDHCSDRASCRKTILDMSHRQLINLLWRLLASISLVSLLQHFSHPANASDFSSQPFPTTQIANPIYAFDSTVGGWRPNNGRWYSYKQARDPCPTELGGFPNNPISPPSCFIWLTGTNGPGSEWIVSEGPWWVDPNHAHDLGGNGFGYIHVIAFSQIPAAHFGPVDLHGTTVTFDARVSASFKTQLAASRYGDETGHVYLWFQTYPRPIADCSPDPQTGENCTRQSNYILTGKLSEEKSRFRIDRLSVGTEISFKYKIDADNYANWTCLGRGRNVKYDCLPISLALRQAAIIGFVLAPVPTCPTTRSATGEMLCDLDRVYADPSRYFPTGKVEIKNFKIAYESLRNITAARISFSERKRNTSLDAWSSEIAAMRESLSVNSGIYIPSPPPTGAFAIGLRQTSPDGTKKRSQFELRLISRDHEKGVKADIAQVVVQGNNRSTGKPLFVAPFESGDNFAIHVRESEIVFLKNASALHTEAFPCSTVDTCRLTPYIRLLGKTPEIPAYRY